MNKKFSLGVTISLIAIACAITFVLTVTISLNTFNQKIAGATEREEIYGKIQEIDTYVRNKSLFDIDEENLKQRVVEGYINGLNDENATYLTADQVYEKQQRESGTIISAGIEVTAEASGYLTVSNIYKDSPAASQDIEVGDTITKIEDKDVLQLEYNDAVQMLSGEDGTKLNIVIQRSGVESSLSITRRSFIIQSVTSSIVNGYGYIRIDAFNKQTATQFTDTVQNLQAQGALGYIIDVRACSGIYDGLSEMLDMFINEQVIANAKFTDDSYQKLVSTTTDGAEITASTVVIIDENTNGPAELFALAMNKYASAQLVGKQSYGNNLQTETRVFSDGSAVTISIATVIPTDSDSYEEGINPNFVVEVTGIMATEVESLDTLTDEQLKKAFEVMESLK